MERRGWNIDPAEGKESGEAKNNKKDNGTSEFMNKLIRLLRRLD